MIAKTRMLGNRGRGYRSLDVEDDRSVFREMKETERCKELMLPPLVSVGVPVYNESRFIKRSLTSLATQDYKHLEIIISDNGSTDETEAICRELAASDCRIDYHRFPENRGVAANFERVLELASGRYFMWASGHDLWDQNMISECVKELERHPNAAIAFGASNWIDKAGEPLNRESGWTDTRGMNAMARFFAVLWGNMHPVLGVIRREYLREIPKIHSCAGSDLMVLSELALKGDFIHVAKGSWSRREFRDEETHRERMQRYKSSEYRLTMSTVDRFFPLLRLPLQLIRVIWHSKLPWCQRLCILFALVPTLPVRYVAGRQ